MAIGNLTPLAPMMPSGAIPKTLPGLAPMHSPMPGIPQMRIPGATANGAQIDRPGGLGGYAAGAPMSLSDRLGQYLSGNEIYQGQKSALNSQLQSSWQTGTLNPIQQALIALGGAPSGLDPSKFSAPQDLYGNPIGQSLVQALSDPALVSSARGNQFSQLATIAQQLRDNNLNSSNSAAARGLVDSGDLAGNASLNQHAADVSTYGANQDFLSTLNSSYNNYLSSLNTAQGQLGDYTQQANDRLVALINQGIFGAPTKAKPSPTYTAPKVSKKAAPYVNPRAGQVTRNSF